jgi:hypothetical protein
MYGPVSRRMVSVAVTCRQEPLLPTWGEMKTTISYNKMIPWQCYMLQYGQTAYWCQNGTTANTYLDCGLYIVTPYSLVGVSKCMEEHSAFIFRVDVSQVG